jgi:phosphoglucosamine mutase
VAVAADSYTGHILERFGTRLDGRKIAVDCANGAYSEIAPGALRQLGAEVISVADEPNGTNINVACGATDLALLQRTVVESGADLGIAFDGDGDRMLAVDAGGNAVDGDQILAILALDLDVDTVVVTVMTNLGFHRLMGDNEIRVVTTDVGDRYVLEALRREQAILGGEQSGHLICLDGHVTGDGLAAALLLCRAIEGRTLAEAAAVMPRFAQAKENVPARVAALPHGLQQALAELNRELNGGARVVVRPSGTEPVVRVLAEAEHEEDASALCARVSALVRRELG